MMPPCTLVDNSRSMGAETRSYCAAQRPSWQLKTHTHTHTSSEMTKK